MGPGFGFHGAAGGDGFLGLRRSRQGEAEIVFDDGGKRRMVWRVLDDVGDSVLRDALRSAADQRRMLPALFSELSQRAIQVEVKAG